MDKIYISGIAVDAIVGIWDWERQIPQTIVIDLEMAADIARAAESDQIDDTLDYKAVSKRVRSLVIESQCRLVETLAERIAAAVRDEFAVGWVRVKINKPGALRGARDVGVIIERGDASMT